MSTAPNVKIAPVAPTPESTATPRIRIEDRRMTLDDFCQTCIKLNGSDIHLQGGSVPMIRVNGGPKFLECPEMTDEQINQCVSDCITDPAKADILEKRGALDLAYQMKDKTARFRVNIFHSRETVRDGHATHRDQDSAI